MIVVSHRGPYRFEANDDGSFAAERGAGGVGERARRRARPSDSGRDVDRGRDLRRRPRGAPQSGVARRSRHRPAARSRSIPSCTACTTTSSRTACCGSCSTAVRPRAPAALRPPLPRGVGRVPRGERRVRRRGGRAAAPRRRRARAGLPARARRRAQLRDLRPDLRVVHFTHTPFCGPDDIARAARPTSADDAVRGAGVAIPPGSTRTRWADAYRPVGARRARPRARRSRRRSPPASGPTSPRSKRSRRRRGRARGRAPARRRGRRPARDRAQRPHRAVEEHRARLPRVRPAARGAARAAGPGRVRRDGVPVAPGASPSTSRTRTRSSRSSRASTIGGRRATGRRSCSTTATTSPARSPAMQRYDVLLVNPIKDGLNLVAKEGPAVNRRDGVLCLSREAGAYEELRGAAIAVHPYDIEQTRPARSTARSRCRSTSGRRARRSCARSRPRARRPTGSPTSSRTRLS